MSTETEKKIVPVCTSKDIGITITTNKNADESDIREGENLINAIDDYLKIFAAPIVEDTLNTVQPSSLTRNLKCLSCGATLGGMLGSFNWGIANGEGECSCGWPARALHDIQDESGENIFNRRLEKILQYHPDFVTTEAKG